MFFLLWDHVQAHELVVIRPLTQYHCAIRLARFLLVESMNGFFALGLLVAAFGLSTGAANAMPLAPIGAEPMTTPVADGCGVNRYRDARGICRKKYVITPHKGRQPFYTGCGGVNSHRVCNLYGQCWMVCD